MEMTKARITAGEIVTDLPIHALTPADPFVVENITGLGPVEVGVSFGKDSKAKRTYQGRQPFTREMVFLITLNPDYYTGQTVAELRKHLYSVLSPGPTDEIKIELLDAEDFGLITMGYVKKFETVPFSKEQKVQITVECPDSYFMGPFVSVNFVPGASFTVENIGTAETSPWFKVEFTSNRSFWTLTKLLTNGGASTGEFFRIDYNFLAGDVLEVNAEPGSRRAKVTRGATVIDLLGYIHANATWPELHRDNNYFSTSSTAITWVSFSYQSYFWGI